MALPRMSKPEGMPVKWDHLPTFDEMGQWLKFLPGVEYCWTLVKNQVVADTEGGFVPIRSMRPLQIEGLDVMLLGRGEPVAGARFEAAHPAMFIDPELEAELQAKGVLEKEAVVQAAPQPPPQKPQAQGQAHARR